MATKPPLALNVEITAADGSTYQWGSGSKAGSIPQGLSFRTSRGNGFADANVTLARRIDQDYVDLTLFDSMVISGAEGSIAYEGRVSGLPRSLQQSHSVTVQATGWMAHTRDRKMSEVYVDRDMTKWGDASITRRAALAAAPRVTGNATVGTDSGGNSALVQGATGPWAQFLQDERYYDAGPNNKIGAIYYDFVLNANVNAADTSWQWSVGVSSDDVLTTATNSGNLRAATGNAYYVPATAYRYGTLTMTYGAISTTAEDFEMYWRNLAVYGDHGLTRQGGSLPGGIYASDAIKHLIGKYCPLLNTSGVQSTTYPIPHLTFNDRVDPYDALLEINKYHLWQLGVYENRTLTYGPVDMSDYDWEVRLSDPGVTVDLQGDSTDDLANGIVVTYTDIAKGTTAVITPTDDTTLADTSPDNPVNQHGLTKWTELTLSTPTDANGAAQIGRAALAEFNQAKGPGTISVQGHIRDRQGHWTPVWAVRAGSRIAITDHANDRPRLVVETDYSHDTKTVSIAVDSQFKQLDAVLDRLSTAISASGISQP